MNYVGRSGSLFKLLLLLCNFLPSSFSSPTISYSSQNVSIKNSNTCSSTPHTPLSHPPRQIRKHKPTSRNSSRRLLRSRRRSRRRRSCFPGTVLTQSQPCPHLTSPRQAIPTTTSRAQNQSSTPPQQPNPNSQNSPRTSKNLPPNQTRH